MIVGVDEVGTGALAGPAAACACALLDGWEYYVEHLDDSKKLSDSRRRAAAASMQNNPKVVFSFSQVSVASIDRIGIERAKDTMWLDAIKETLCQLKMLEIVPERVLLDGIRLPKGTISVPFECEAKADGKYPEVSAASILAKVWRDDKMIALGRMNGYACWHFHQHKGYGTPQHRTAIRIYGLSDQHRRTFCKKLKKPDPHKEKMWKDYWPRKGLFT